MHENEIGTVLVDCAVRLHQTLGPGLLEVVYEVALARELQKRGFRVERQVAVPIEYDGERFDEGSRADLIVEGKVIVELKSVERINPAPQEADFDISSSHRNEAQISPKLRRGLDEGWHHAND